MLASAESIGNGWMPVKQAKRTQPWAKVRMPDLIHQQCQAGATWIGIEGCCLSLEPRANISALGPEPTSPTSRPNNMLCQRGGLDGVSPAGNIYDRSFRVGGLGSVSSVLLLAYIDFDVDLSTR